ncbi:MAG TPA: PAS domain S-box protein, partial [Thermoanaerobaculia bacterium]
MRALLLEDGAAQRLTQYLLDRAGEGAFWADSDGRFFYVNEAACSMMGYTREEMLEMGVADILP